MAKGKTAKTTPKSSTAKKRATTPKVAKTNTAKPRYREARTKDFMVIQFTRDTLYWLIFGLVAIIFVIWVMSLQHQVNDLYDQIHAEKMSSAVDQQKLRYYNALEADDSKKD